MSELSISETPYQRALRLVEEHVARLDRYWKGCASGGALGAVNVIRGKHRNLENILKVVSRNVRTLHALDRQKLRNLITEASWREEAYNRINGSPDDMPDQFAVHLETLERDFIRRWENIARRERARGKGRSVSNPSSSRRRAMNTEAADADAQLGVAIALLRRRRELAATIDFLKLIDLPEPHRTGGFVWFNKKNRDATEWGDNGDSFWAHHYRLPVGHQYPSILIELEACGCREEFFGVFYYDEEAVEALNAVGIYEELSYPIDPVRRVLVSDEPVPLAPSPVDGRSRKPRTSSARSGDTHRVVRCHRVVVRRHPTGGEMPPGGSEKTPDGW